MDEDADRLTEAYKLFIIKCPGKIGSLVWASAYIKSVRAVVIYDCMLQESSIATIICANI